MLAAPGTGSSVTAGVVPSFSLGFSPVAASASPGGSWTTGVLPAGLVAAPDAIAVSGSGRRLALLSGSSGALVSSPGGLSTWTTVATDREISSGTAVLGCELVAPSAVAADRGSILVGGRCRHGAHLPIAVRHGGTWRLVAQGPPADDAVVLRLAPTLRGAVALLSCEVRARPAVVVAWTSSGARRWSGGPALLLDDARSVLSTSLDADGTATVVLSSSSGERTARSLAPGAPAWAVLPRLPLGTFDVVTGAPPQALAANHSTLTVYDERGGAWRVVQRLEVPIEYGSSS